MKQQYILSIKQLSHNCLCIFLILMSCLYWYGCSDGYLKDEPVIQVFFPEAVYVSNESELQFLSLDISEAKNASYQIRQYPKWMEFQQMNGTFSDGKTTLYFNIKPEELQNYGENSGELMISVQGFGLVQVNIIVGEKNDPGQFLISIDPEKLDFKTDISEISFSMWNQSENQVTWKVVDSPEWVQLENREGTLHPGNMHLNVTCNRINLLPGVYNGSIGIEFSGENGSKQTKKISVATEVIEYLNPADLIEIEGHVADAIYCKQTDRLFIITQNPNRLLVYSKKNGMIETALSRVPKCLTLSENGQQLFIGHSGLVTCIDNTTLQVRKSYDLDFGVFSLAYGENDWIYLSPDAEYVNEPIICLNLSSGKIIRKGETNCSGRTHFKKIKGSTALLCTREFISPSGIILLDISNGTPENEKYWHIDFGRSFWFSENGKYVYGAYGNVFNVPNFNTGPDILPLGELERYMSTNYMDHCAETNSIWVAPNNFWDEEQSVNRYHADDYHLIKSFKIANYATTINGIQDYYKTIPYYIFSDKAGKNVFVIKNIFIDFYDNADAWSIETLTFD